MSSVLHTCLPFHVVALTASQLLVFNFHYLLTLTRSSFSRFSSNVAIEAPRFCAEIEVLLTTLSMRGRTNVSLLYTSHVFHIMGASCCNSFQISPWTRNLDSAGDSMFRVTVVHTTVECISVCSPQMQTRCHSKNNSGCANFCFRGSSAWTTWPGRQARQRFF